MQLRKYQEETLGAIVENLKAGVRQQLIVWATGCGKTVLAAQLPSVLKTALPGKMLFIAHRNELLTQAVDKIKTWNPSLKVGLEKAEAHADVDCDIVVASSASIGRSGSTRMSNFWDDISTIVVDEAHHILGGSYMNILEDSGVLKPESTKLLVGLTATPKRRNLTRTEKKQITTLDDEGIVSLKSVFQKIVYNYPLRKAIKEGFLVPLRGYRVNTQTSLDEVKVTAGDFQTDQLSKAVNVSERNLQIVKSWKEYAEGRPTVVFTVDVQHAKDLSEAFLHNGVLAQPIWGDDPQRAEKLTWHETGKVTVLCNCALLTEGYDSPTLSCIVLARPTKSGTLMTQQVGRGTRLYLGKENCIVIDVVDNTKRNSLVTFPSLLGLVPNMDLHGQDVVKAIEEIEDLQNKYVGADFSELTDITKVKTFVESIDLFHEPYTEDVKELSTMSWMSTSEGYSLAIPERKDLADAKQYSRFIHEKLNIEVNQLDEYELSISSKETERKLGTYNTLKEAFDSAEDVLRRCRTDRVKLLLRDAPWHSNPASEAAKKSLRRLTKKKPLFWCVCEGVKEEGKICPTCKLKTGLTAGMASLALNVLKTK